MLTYTEPASIVQRNTHLGIQVNATPKRFNKKRDAIAAMPDGSGPCSEVCDIESIPSSNAFIPSSTIRPANPMNRSLPHGSTQVFHTPSRSGKALHPISHQVMGAHVLAEQTPYQSASQLDSKHHVRSAMNSFTTPTKPGAACSRYLPNDTNGQATVLPTPAPTFSRAPYLPSHTVLVPSKTKENRAGAKSPGWPGSESDNGPPKSIYENLGWDDDDELI